MPLTPLPLNDEQTAAVDKMLAFLQSYDPNQPFFLLEGYAGTGKTYSLQEVIRRFKGRLVFSAPTNKATKVLRETLASDHYKPECRTIYSILGLKLEANGEVKELAIPDDPLDLTQFSGIVVDEASMVNVQVMYYITLTAKEQGIPFIFMGDPAQLPPVKELRSPVWGLAVDGPQYAQLIKVMRHDNQILSLVTRIREVVDHPFPNVKIVGDNDGEEGVWAMPGIDFRRRLIAAADAGVFSVPGKAKALAWRNVTVDDYNSLIRNRIFGNPTEAWLPGDRIIATAPAKDLQDDPMAMTDDEGEVTKVAEDWHPLYPEFKVYRLSTTFDDNRLAVFQVLHPLCVIDWNRKREELAAAARTNRHLWKNYWEFIEAFHSVRYAYATTVHRSQGSTYETVFVDWRDILSNRARQEAFRCLYVACSRPKKQLILN